MKKLYVVVHTLTDAQVIANADVAMGNGADGVFVIDQNMRDPDLVGRVIPALRKRVPWLGVNLLRRSPGAVVQDLHGLVDAVWSDTSHFPEEVVAARERTGWEGRWFGGLAFKYTADEKADASRIADLVAMSRDIDVVTTSGPATGSPAPRSKVDAFRKALGDRPLALASGVSAENVGLFPDVDCFIVASSLERSFGHLDPVKVRELADMVHAL